MTLTRIVRPGLLAALLVAAVGCAPSTPSSGDGAGKPSSEASPKTDEFVSKARTFALDFLKAVKAGKGDPAQLSAAFKKVYSPAEREDEKALGYSDAAAAQLLKLAATEVGDDLSIVSTDGRFALFVAKGKTGERTLVRVADDGGLKIDWLSVSPKNLPESKFAKGEGDAAQFATMAFLDAVLTPKFHLAEGLLTDAARAKLGASVIDGKYNFGSLEIRLKELFGGAKTYTVTVATKDTVTATVGGKTATLKLTAGRSPAEMKVDQVEVK
jgi:hypothetical protein